MKNFTFSLLTLFLITLSSCSEMTKEFKFMNELRSEISEEYDTNEVEINLRNKNILVVSFSDSKFDDYSSGEKKRIAKRIGAMVRKKTKNREPIKSGKVEFVDETEVGILKQSDSDTYNMYEEVAD